MAATTRCSSSPKYCRRSDCADVGFALYVGITQPHGMGSEYEFTGIGILVFLAGYIIEGCGFARANDY